ncbi:hypothetical protein [Roseococcus sp.]|uniref:hypothetical protein n=1 Tax=Roseococcus sp. TaxID=2109646 RepID=UPI003BAA8A25
MLAISRRAAAVLMMGTTLASGPALATGAVVNHVLLPQGATMEACLQRAAMAIATVGLSPLNTTRSAAWGQRDGGRIYTIYCMAAQGAAVFVAAGNTSADVSSDLTALMQAFRSNGSGGGSGGKIPLSRP